MPNKTLAVSALLLCWLVQPVPASENEGRINLAGNGSFEGGIDFNFSMGRWYLNGLPSARLDDTTKVHGLYSLKIPFSPTALLTKPAQYEGVQFRSAVPTMVERGRGYNFSVYLKADAPKHGEISITPNSPSEYRGAPLARKSIEVGKEWRRVGLTFTPGSDGNVYWQIDVVSDMQGFLWVDAVQLEQGSFSEFRPHAAVEAGLTSSKPGMIYAPDEPVVLTLSAYNDSAESMVDFPFTVEVYDLDGRMVFSTVIVKTLPPKASIKMDVVPLVKKMGLYRCVLSSSSSQGLKSELHFSVLPRPRPVSAEQSAFGAYLTIAPEPLNIARRIGFHWIAHLTSNGRLYSWGSVEPRENEFLWYDEDVALAKREGYQMMFNLEPCNAPQWASGLSDEERLNKWKNYVSALVSHYRGGAVRYWTISDEAQSKKCWSRPQDYAKWHRAGYEAIKGADPDAKVIFNTSAEYAEQVLQTLPPRYVDIFAGNFYHMPAGIERLQKLAARYGGKEIWAPGVGDWMLPYYRKHLSQEQLKSVSNDYWATKVTAQIKSVIETFAHGATRLFHYTATYVGNTNNFSVFEADSALKPNGAQFAALTWLIDGFSEAKTVTGAKLPWDSSMVVIRIDRLDGNTVFAFWSRKTPAKKLRLLNVNNAAGLKLYDQFANPVPLKAAPTSIDLEVGIPPLFLVTPQRAADEIEKSLGKALTMMVPT